MYAYRIENELRENYDKISDEELIKWFELEYTSSIPSGNEK